MRIITVIKNRLIACKKHIRDKPFTMRFFFGNRDQYIFITVIKKPCFQKYIIR